MFLSCYERVEKDVVIRYAPSPLKLDYKILYRGPFSKTVSDVIQSSVGGDLDEDLVDVGLKYPLHIYLLDSVNERVYREGCEKLREVFQNALRDISEILLRRSSMLCEHELEEVSRRVILKLVKLTTHRVRTVVRVYGHLSSEKLEKLSLSIIGLSKDRKAEYLRLNVDDVAGILGLQMVSLDKLLLSSEKYLRKLARLEND
ncbi:MAG: hypothetical protein GXO23_04585 [Crenarchaeota archaeon]|nr:hypothetical protein [Thermoproteota archaeon]